LHVTGGLLIFADIVLPTFEQNAFSSSHLSNGNGNNCLVPLTTSLSVV